MKEYNEILDSIRVAEMRDKAEAYFEKYWLDKDEYFEKWLPIQNSIFDSRAEFLPDMMFKTQWGQACDIDDSFVSGITY